MMYSRVPLDYNHPKDYQYHSYILTTSVVLWLVFLPRVWWIVGSSFDQVKPITMTLVFVASPLITQH
jgi:hypothetical protein